MGFSRSGVRSAALVLFLSLGGALGCGNPYAGEFEYRPNPYATTLKAGENGAAEAVEVLVSIRGVRTAEDGEGAVLDTKLYLTNLADRPARFEPESLALFSADLLRFEDPRTTPSEAVTLEPGESSGVLARFPFPDGLKPSELDMSGLSLRWAVQIGDQRLTRNITFNRVWYERYYAYPRHYYWDGAFGPGAGGLYYSRFRGPVLD